MSLPSHCTRLYIDNILSILFSSVGNRRGTVHYYGTPESPVKMTETTFMDHPPYWDQTRPRIRKEIEAKQIDILRSILARVSIKNIYKQSLLVRKICKWWMAAGRSCGYGTRSPAQWSG